MFSSHHPNYGTHVQIGANLSPPKKQRGYHRRKHWWRWKKSEVAGMLYFGGIVRKERPVPVPWYRKVLYKTQLGVPSHKTETQTNGFAKKWLVER